jgi:hypothetical protein
MSQITVGNWPPTLHDDHLAYAPKSDWAWEFLRRNADYRRAAAKSQSEMVKVGTVGSAVPVFRLYKQEEAARDWAQCSFR